MLCENCGRNTATVYLKNNINGNISETRLCQNCAGKNNINLFENSLNNFDLFNAINFGQLSPGYNAERKVCALCGTAFAQIAQSGKIGCGDCYSEFKAELEPTIIKIHGRAKHTGKIPANLESKISLKRKAEELNTRLKKMIESQNFEEAAVIRDEIISLNQEV
jgi:protein arginine kinase activator